MATYPAYPQMLGSTEEWLDDVSVDRSAAGGAKARALWTSRKRRFVLKHKLAVADVYTAYAGSSANALKTFYDTNRLAKVSFYWAKDAQTYSCYFESPPRLSFPTASIIEVEVRLVEA